MLQCTDGSAAYYHIKDGCTLVRNTGGSEREQGGEKHREPCRLAGLHMHHLSALNVRDRARMRALARSSVSISACRARHQLRVLRAREVLS